MRSSPREKVKKKDKEKKSKKSKPKAVERELLSKSASLKSAPDYSGSSGSLAKVREEAGDTSGEDTGHRANLRRGVTPEAERERRDRERERDHRRSERRRSRSQRPQKKGRFP